MLKNIEKILTLSKKKIDYLHNIDNRGWYSGSDTYIKSIKEELLEAENELKDNNNIYLEDELGDIFWDYICLLNSLEQEGKITSSKVFERCYNKFNERLGGTGNGGADWQKIKELQKAKLENEHNETFKK